MEILQKPKSEQSNFRVTEYFILKCGRLLGCNVESGEVFYKKSTSTWTKVGGREFSYLLKYLRISNQLHVLQDLSTKSLSVQAELVNLFTKKGQYA